MNKLFLKKGSGLVVLPEKNDNILKSARNIDRVSVMEAKDLNALDLLSSKYLLMMKGSADVIKETFLK